MALSVSVQTYGKRDGYGFNACDLVPNFAAFTGRKSRTEEQIDKMVDSLLRHGQEQNFLYRKGFNEEPIPVTGHTRILAGARITDRRMKSLCGKIQYGPENPFPIFGTFRKMNEFDAMFHTFAENDDETRTAMNAVDIALFISTAKQSGNMTTAQLAAKMGKSVSWISQHESVIEMDHSTQNGLAAGDFSLNTALTISEVAPVDRSAVVEKARNDHKAGRVTAAGVAQAARDLKATTKPTARMAPKWTRVEFCAILQQFIDMELPPKIAEMTVENAVRTVLGQIQDEIHCGEM